MALTSQDIDRIANLARLELSPEESERMLSQLNSFFGIVEKMQAVDTSGVQPLAHPVAAIQDVVLRLREEFAIYAVASGRINVAGMTPDNMAPLCEAIVAVL